MRRHETDRRGLSLVEVLLALAVLSVAMGLLGHLIRLGGRQATAAHQTTQAQLHAQSIMAQVVGRALPLSAAQNTPVPTDDNYVYSITTQSLDLDYLMAVTVTVSYNDPQDTKPTSVSLVRWMVDPDYLDQLEAEAAAAEEEAAAAAEAEGQDA